MNMIQKWLKPQTENILYDFDEAEHFIRTRQESGQWFMVVGSERSGKSQLTKRFNLPTIHEIKNSYSLHDNFLFERFHWHFTKEIIFTEYAIPVSKGPFSTHSFPYFESLLSQITKASLKKHLTGILWVISIDEFTDREHLQSLQTSLHNMTSVFFNLIKKNLPIHIVISKADHLRGFTEFFSDATDKNFSYPFFIDFKTKTELPLLRVFENSMTELKKTVYASCLWKTQHERSQYLRTKVQEFPVQFDIFIETLLHFISKFEARFLKNLNGLFFCSIQQNNTEHDFIQQQLTQSFEVSSLKKILLPKTSKSYFVQFTLDQIKNHTKKLWRENLFQFFKTSLFKWNLILATGLLGVFACLSAYTFKNNYHMFQDTKMILAEYRILMEQKSSGNESLIKKSLSCLERLSQSSKKILEIQSKTMNLVTKKEITTTLNTLQEARHKILANNILPLLKEKIEKKLTAEIKGNTSSLYESLKAYVMLAEPPRLDPVFFKDYVFSSIAASFSLPPSDTSFLLENTVAFLQSNTTKETIDLSLVSTAREALSKLPPSYLAFLFLTDDFHMSSSSFKSEDTRIPALYQPESLLSILEDKIGSACRSFPNKSWILGHPQNSTFGTDVFMKECTQQTQKFFFEQYKKWWEAFLNKIFLGEYHSVAQLSETLQKLSADNFSLLKSIELFLQTKDPLEKAVTSAETVHGATLKKLLNQSPPLDFQKYIVSLHTKIQNLMHNPGEGSFLIAKAYFENKLPPSDEILFSLPSDIKTQYFNTNLDSFQKTVAHVVLKEAFDHIQYQWKTTVLEYYQNKVQDKYPFSEKSDPQITLQDFHPFFKPKGMMDHFFSEYIEPFVDTHQTTWPIKTVNTYEMPFDDETIQQFIRANLIRKMFYSDNGDHIEIGFTLVLKALGPAVEELQIEAPNRTIYESSRHHFPQHITWDDTKNKLDPISLSFINEEGEADKKTFTGPWAIFKLLSNTHIHPTSSPTTYQLTFDLNGKAAKYTLVADNLINPFIPGIMQEFKCPKTL